MPYKHDEKQHRRNRRDAKLPAPLRRAKVSERDEVVGQIGEQDADDDVDLKHSNQPAAPFRGRKLRDVDRPQNRRAADIQVRQ